MAQGAVGWGNVRALEKLWQGCGKNPDVTAKTDITDILWLSKISNLRVCNAPRLHPAYRLIRQNLCGAFLWRCFRETPFRKLDRCALRLRFCPRLPRAA